MSDEQAYLSSMSQENGSEKSRSVSHPSRVGIYEFTQEQQDRVLEILSRNVSCPFLLIMQNLPIESPTLRLDVKAF